MKNLIKILSLILIISFVNLEANANPLNIIKKGLDLGKKFSKIGKHALPSRNDIIFSDVNVGLKKLNNIVEKTANTKERCLNVNKKINDEEYRNSILEKLEDENEGSEESLSPGKNPKTLIPLICNWSSEKCTCRSKKKSD